MSKPASARQLTRVVFDILTDLIRLGGDLYDVVLASGRLSPVRTNR